MGNSWYAYKYIQTVHAIPTCNEISDYVLVTPYNNKKIRKSVQRDQTNASLCHGALSNFQARINDSKVYREIC